MKGTTVFFFLWLVTEIPDLLNAADGFQFVISPAITTLGSIPKGIHTQTM